MAHLEPEPHELLRVHSRQEKKTTKGKVRHYELISVVRMFELPWLRVLALK